MSVPAGERRVVSVLVADVAGSTGIGEKLGPERSKFLFDEVLRLMRQEVERIGGTVAQLTGDGMLALFGAPTAHEDDAERAVRAALAIHEALGHYDADIGPAYGIELQARVAVNTGPVVVPAGDEPPERLYNALGDTVNVAARLEGAAGGGGVCVGETTARQVESVFELDPLGELDVKGKAAPVTAFVVTGVREPEPSERELPLVGREQELGVVDETMAALLERSGAVISITGEPGIGKSRLVAAAKERYGEDVRFLEGHAVSYAENSPYWPIREFLRDWLGLGVSDPEARVRLEIRAGLARALGDEAEEAYPFLATLFGLPLEEEAHERLRDLSRDSIQRQTVDWLLRLTCALARERPLCVVLEDLHWADEATLAAIEELLSATDDEPVAVVLVHRSDPDYEAWHVVDRARRRYRHRFRELELGALAPDATRQLADSRAGAELPEAVAELLAERSGGNPFFLEEALRDLFERGALRRTDGRFELAAGLGALAVPALVQEALQARLDRLAPDTRDVVNVAAVIGRSFGLPLLERLLPRERLSAALAELQRLDLVVEERRQPAREYRFRHGLVQDVAYASLVEARRRELHSRVGEALEDLHRESPEEVYALLAHHFSEADDLRRAADYLLRAGDAARALFADQEAISHYRRALEFLDRLNDHTRARETLFKVALTHHLAFDFERANQAYEDAFQRPAGPPQRLEPGERIATAGSPIGNLAPGHAYVTSDVWLVDLLFRGLLKVDRALNVVPDLAETFGIADDGLEYEFRIRPDARWSDGKPVTAHDFVATWQAMREQETASSFLIEDMVGAVALDEHKLEFRLREPRSYFPYVLAGPWSFPWPRHKLEELGDDWRRPESIVGNGPFAIAEVDDEHLLLVASPFWAGPRGNVGSIHIRLTPQPNALLDDWRGGRFDVLSLGRAVETSPHWNAELVSSLEIDFLAFNARVPPFDDRLVRKAFAHAVDREAQRRAWGDDLDQPSLQGGAIPPALPGHSHRIALQFDLERARQLLASAGFPEGRGLPEVLVALPAESAHVDAVAADLVAQWGRLGARVKIDRVPVVGMLATVGAGANIWAYGWAADYPDPDGFLRTFIRATPWVFCDRRLEDLLDRARSLRNQDERIRLYQEFERLWIAEEAAILPLAYDRWLSLSRPWVDGLWTSPLTRGMLDEVIVRPELRRARGSAPKRA